MLTELLRGSSENQQKSRITISTEPTARSLSED
jgi:hypothetical protein